MARPTDNRRRLAVAVALVAVAPAGCGNRTKDPALSRPDDGKVPEVPTPAADGPRLGAIANATPVLERPARGAPQIGYLHAGARVPRAEKPYSTDGCPGGWYPIRPRGFVCLDDGATNDLGHPTLAAMSLAPRLDQPLPYTYARIRQETPLYERDPSRDDGVREVGKLPGRSALAVVGSWSAADAQGRPQRLALMTNGQFVRAADLEPLTAPTFAGVELGAAAALPIAFVVKRGVRAWSVEKGEADKREPLDYHATLKLTGKYREVDGLRYWALDDGRFARHRDVTVVRERNVWPDFATGARRWVDVSVVTGTLVLYEGRKPVFVTLCSVGRDKLGDPATTASTALGALEVVGKHVTAVGADAKKMGDPYAAYDAPYALELGNGQLLHGAYWHARFGIENGPGNIQVSPSDAARLFAWVGAEVPEGWHGVSGIPGGADGVIVLVRK
ncbi:MAG: L,D-transpeptidase [Polyangiaceae bacterium]|nr:L,D-transpeptidase [Polyangiaceae bacterium]